MTVSGWCSGPTGSRLKCDGCESSSCEHGCHESRSTTGVSTIASGKIGETERAPDRVLGGPQSRALDDYQGVAR